MRKEYHSSNVRFCMDDENQRRTWEYLQSITRKEGSYGKILSDAFVQILDGNHAIEQGAFQQNNAECVTEQMLSMQLATLKRELLEEMESIYGNALPAASQTGDHRDEMEQEAAEVPEPDMSDAMMTMALAMGDWVELILICVRYMLVKIHIREHIKEIMKAIIMRQSMRLEE